MFCAGPGGDHTPESKTQKQRRLAPDERQRVAALLVEIGVLAELCITARLFIAGDALNASDSMRIKNVIVADPQFERQTGAHCNEAMKLRVVAERPGQAAEENQRAADRRLQPSGVFFRLRFTEPRPAEQKRQTDSDGGI